mgnify:CR=1 FL=1|jgi:hypothetical protein
MQWVLEHTARIKSSYNLTGNRPQSGTFHTANPLTQNVEKEKQ